MSSTARIAWRNLGRNRRRTALMLTAIAMAQMSVLLMDGLMNGWVDMTIDALTGPMMGHVQVHAPEWREEQAPDLVIDDVDARLEALRGVEGVEEAYARIYAPALVAREVDGHAVVIVGVDVPREARVGGMLEGLPEAGRPSGRRVLVGASLARETGIEVGDELAVLGQAADGSMAADLVTVVGLLQSPVELVNRMGIVMPLDAAQETFAMPDQAHEITIRGSGTPDEAAALSARVARTEGFEELEVLPWKELAPEMSAFLDIADVYGLVVLFIVFLAAAAGVMNTMLMATFERRRELGMLLSLGTTPARLVRMILTEAVVMGLCGVALGSVIGGLIVLWQGHAGISMILTSEEEVTEVAMYGISFTGELFPRLSWSDFIPGFVGVSVVSVVAALWPAIHTARLEPMEAMRS